MLVLDRDALICDMAETYHILDMWSIPLKLLATLASGLGMDSRINLKKHGFKASWQTVLLAMFIDGWSSNTSKGFTDYLVVKNDKSKKSNSAVFNSIEEYEAAKAKILGGHTDG